jgi:hypothetical protein
MPIKLGVNHTGIATELLKELTAVMEWIQNWSPEFVDSIGWKEREKRVRELIEKAKQELK